ncbi:MAG TPA: protein kinase [Anaerolineales bacterium]|nr:protein kinase [Anaerolineales bacterium]
MLPETIGRYKIKEELGRSQSTIVYRALDNQTNREVVVKLFALEPTGDPARDMSLKAHFRRELKMISSLEHPAIVPVYDVGEQNGQPYFVMRYMAGGSLNRLIAKKGRLSLEETAQIIDRIVPALDSAHKQNIIHRDIKPDNILFDLDGHPYISDFGVAKPDKNEDSDFEGMIGTPGYMASEQIANGDVDERTDVFGLGVVICQMLSGKPPSGIAAETSTSKSKGQEHTIPDILSDVPELPPEMEEFLNIVLAEEKQHRYVTTLDLARALNRIAFGEDYVSAARERQSRGSPLQTSLIWIFGSLALLVVFFWMFARGGNIPFLSVASTPTVGPLPSETGVFPTEEFTPIPPTATATIEPTPTLEPVPVDVYPGSADQVALLSGNQIYLMNADGSGLIQVRTENSPKSNLQWIPDNRLVYISRNCAYLLDAETKQTERLSCFTSNEQLEGFNVSPDGKYVAISVQRTLNIIPFDVDMLKTVTTRFNLVENKDNCFYNQFPFLEVFWAKDQTRLVAHVIDTRLANSDQLFLLNLDIQNCDNVDLTRIDVIPGGRIDFDPDSTKRIGSYDWNGMNLFLINDAIRNDGFGNLYLYNSDTSEVTEINPIDGQCCYRDPRWSPDGKYIMFAFQRFDRSSIDLYYVPFADIQSGVEFTPIDLPNIFFTSSREKPQPVLRTAP